MVQTRLASSVPRVGTCLTALTDLLCLGMSGISFITLKNPLSDLDYHSFYHGLGTVRSCSRDCTY